MFNKNKNKPDYRVRFQNTGFKRRLDARRSYRRVTKTFPKSDWGVFLSKVGLGSWVNRLITLLVFAALVYIVYIPNFLFIKHINLNGVAEYDKPAILATVSQFLNKTSPWPQRNLAILSTSRLKNFLLAENFKVLEIKNINKDFPNSLNIELAPRLDKFNAETAAGNFIVSNDGRVTGRQETTASGSLPSNLNLIKLTTGAGLYTGAQAFPRKTADFMLAAQIRLADLAQNPVSFFEYNDATSTDLTVYFKTGLKVYFNLSFEPRQALDRFEALYGQLNLTEQKKINYVDMRFKDKGFLCFKDAVCSQILPLKASASSTPAQ